MSSQRPFPGFERIYEVTDPLANRPYRGSMDLDFATESALIRGERLLDEPVVVRYAMGGAPSDIIWTTSVGPIIVSQRVVDLFTSAGFTGWATYPVVVYGKDGQPAGPYHGLAITGRCGPIDWSQSQIALRQAPMMTEPVYRGMYFDPATWDGSDLFFPDLGGTAPLLVEEVVRALRRAKIRNLRLTPLTEVEADKRLIDRILAQAEQA